LECKGALWQQMSSQRKGRKEQKRLIRGEPYGAAGGTAGRGQVNCVRAFVGRGVTNA
jgi:hypothetical protein